MGLEQKVLLHVACLERASVAVRLQKHLTHLLYQTRYRIVLIALYGPEKHGWVAVRFEVVTSSCRSLVKKVLSSVFIARSMKNNCLAGGSRTWIIMSSPLFVSLCFPKICLSIPHLNDAIGWILIYLHEFLVNSCGSFIGLLFSTYCAGTVGWKRSTWI